MHFELKIASGCRQFVKHKNHASRRLAAFFTGKILLYAGGKCIPLQGGHQDFGYGVNAHLPPEGKEILKM